MANSDERRSLSSYGPWLQVMVLVALAAGNLLKVSPFEADAPVGHPEMLPAKRVSEIQRIPARFWEDPLADALGDGSDGKEGSALVDGEAHRIGIEIRARVRAVAGGTEPIQATAVLVLLPGGPYPEDHETRLRTRQALQTAFLAEGLSGHDTRRLGGVWIARPGEESGSDGETGGNARTREPMPVAFELYRKEKHSVLVLWIDEERVTRNFHSRLGQIRRRLLDPDPKAERSPGDPPETPPVIWTIRVVGPSNSDDLLRIAKSPPEKNASPSEDPILLFSPWATAVEDRDLPGKDTAVKVVRTIGHDRNLAAVLRKELELRGSGGDESERAILLVAEADTAYGSAWADLLDRAFDARKPRFLVREYLRGLDGARGLRGDGEGAAAGGGEDPGEDAASLERAEGNPQFDYIRRLQTELVATLDPSAPRKVVAIGVFGSEVHDKLLILQALRPIAGSTPIFTTDLDARLFEPRRWRYTRNLLVATHYGLTLADPFQPHSPPFRDGYQTSAFVAFRMALPFEPPLAASGVRGAPWDSRTDGPPPDFDPVPRLYEIGRYGPVDLTVRSTDRPGRPDLSPLRTGATRTKERTRLGLACALVLLLGLTRPASRVVRATIAAWRDRSRAPAAVGRLAVLRGWLSADRWLLLVGGGAGLALATFVTREAARDDGEPFHLHNGTSAWPCVILRALAVSTAIVALVEMPRQFRAFLAGVRDGLLPGQSPADSTHGLVAEWKGESRVAHPAARRGLFRALRKANLSAWGRSGVTRKGDELWREFRRLHRAGPTALRLSLRVVLWGFVFIGSYHAFAFPVRPVRGETARALDATLLWISVALAGWVMLWVTDRARAFREFARFFGERRLEWDANSLAKVSPKLKSKAAAAELLEMRILERLSALVSSWVFFPAFVVMLLLAARSALFDYWGWPPALLLPLAAIAAGVVLAAVLLRRTAREAREASLDRLRVESANASLGETERAELALAKEEIESMRRGAFRPFAEEPLLRAVLFPLGGLGVLEGLDHVLAL